MADITSMTTRSTVSARQCAGVLTVTVILVLARVM